MIHIVIIDGNETYRNNLCECLSNQKDFSIAGAGADSYSAVKLVDTHKPDIVLMDVNLPLGDGLKTASLIKYRSPRTSIIINWDGKEQGIFSVLFSTVSGYITKQASNDLVCHGIRAIYYGGSLVTPDIAKKFRTITDRNMDDSDSCSIAELPQTISPSEKRIMEYVCRGFTNREIAEKLHLTEGTIRNYVSSLLQKTGLRDRTQMAIYAVKAGL